jgi:hypothetical protein
MTDFKEFESVVFRRDVGDVMRGTLAVVMEPPRNGFVMVEIFDDVPRTMPVETVPVDSVERRDEDGNTRPPRAEGRSAPTHH